MDVTATSSLANPTPVDLGSLSQEERQTWRDKGTLPEPKADSAPAKESSEAKPETVDAENIAPASEAGKQAQEKPRDNAETRKAQLNAEIRELLKQRDTLKQEAHPPKKDVIAEPSPAKASELKAPVEPDQANFDTYEALEKAQRQYVKDLAKYEAAIAVEAYKAEQVKAEQQKAFEAGQKEFQAKIEEVEKRYPDFREKTKETAELLAADPQNVISAMVNDSEIFGDLLYVLSGDAELQNILELGRTNPGKAIRKLALLEDLTIKELAKTVTKAEPAKIPITRGGKPVSEVGGRGTDTEDAVVSAAKAGDFRSFKAESDRQFIESHK